MNSFSPPSLLDRELDCLAPPDAPTLPVFLTRPGEIEALLAALPAPQARLLCSSHFTAEAGAFRLLGGAEGLEGAVLGLGQAPVLHVTGALPGLLPHGTSWHLAGAAAADPDAALGYCLGAYTPATKPRQHPPALLAGETPATRAIAQASWMVRDLINLPANLLGPSELATTAALLASAHGGAATIIAGAELASNYPALAAVGRGSVRTPRVVHFTWQGSEAAADAPLISLCGKGVCFDTGGYDLKPSAGMLRMKKDMGGAAIALGVARLVMRFDLPVRLAVRLGCVENALSGDAMRPGDILATRRGIAVEIGNTDAEGRLVLCDLLAEASDENPDLLLDFATLTGAARVALGPDLVAMFCNDDALAEQFLHAGRQTHDPAWRLPLWSGYDSWITSACADIVNVAAKPQAGAIIAALFLQRFVKSGVKWAHFDTYCWNDATRPGRPEGGEAQALRCILFALRAKYDIAAATSPHTIRCS